MKAQWIKLSDQFPPEWQYVLVAYERNYGNYKGFDVLQWGGEKFGWSGIDKRSQNKPYFWMELPKCDHPVLPKGDQKHLDTQEKIRLKKRSLLESR